MSRRRDATRPDSSPDTHAPDPHTLDPRARHLLRTLIARYIRSGEPVGSQTLARHAGLDGERVRAAITYARSDDAPSPAGSLASWTSCAPASRSRISHSGGWPDGGLNTGSDHFRQDDTA